MVANALARRLRREGFNATAVHRDVSKTRPRRAAGKGAAGREGGASG
jgi:hypothetical protein